LDSGDVGSVSVGFSPNGVLFSADGTTAVVMSRSKVVKVDLGTFEAVLEAPLTLDADAEVQPSGAALTPDGTTLLITVEGSSDLYMLDLETNYWNIGSLGGVPATMSIDPINNQSVFVFGNRSEVNILDNAQLETFNAGSIDAVELEEPSNAIIMTDNGALLYNTSSSNYHDVYRLDLNNQDLIEYVMENPVTQMQVTASGSHAVGILRPEENWSSSLEGFQDSRWGLGVVELTDDESTSLVTESEPVGVALVAGEDTEFALVLLEGMEYLLHVDLSDPSTPGQIDLPAPPVSIGAMPDGRFLIAHDDPSGLISFLDPETLDLNSVGGFALTGLLVQETLPRLAGEE